MRLKEAGWLVLVTILLISPAVVLAQTVVGSSVADAQGNCTIDISVDPGADPQFVADELKDYLQLSGGAILQSISVQGGVAHIECSNAIANSTVEALLPADIASAIEASGMVAEPAISTGAKVGAAALGLTGLGLGSAALAGAFDDDELAATGER